MNLEKQELEEWLRLQNEKEEDQMAVFKYEKQDNNRIKEYTIQIEKMYQEVHRHKNALNAEVTETQVAQAELDRTTDTFRQLHKERQELIQRWENTIQAIRQRDKEIEDAEKHLKELQVDIRKGSNSETIRRKASDC
jgi:UDP-glucose:O-linked fucose beta-1,3-glucosyltransferase